MWENEKKGVTYLTLWSLPAQKGLVILENHVAPVVFCILKILTFLVMKEGNSCVVREEMGSDSLKKISCLTLRKWPKYWPVTEHKSQEEQKWYFNGVNCLSINSQALVEIGNVRYFAMAKLNVIIVYFSMSGSAFARRTWFLQDRCKNNFCQSFYFKWIMEDIQLAQPKLQFHFLSIFSDYILCLLLVLRSVSFSQFSLKSVAIYYLDRCSLGKRVAMYG